MGIPECTFLIEFADDIATVIIGKDVDVYQLRFNQVMRRVSTWMEEHGLELAAAKVETVLLTKRRIDTLCHRVGDETVQTTRAAMYLGVMLDNKLTFGVHINRTADRAAAVTSVLTRVMTNSSEPWPSKLRLLMHTAESIMLYGAEVWADTLLHNNHRRRMAKVQRRAALRIARAYRTVSEPTALIIARVIPIDLLAQGRCFVHQQTAMLGKVNAHKAAKTNIITA